MFRIPRLTMYLTVLLVVGCHPKHHEHHQRSKFAVTNPVRNSTDLTQEYVAQIHAIQHIEVRALERGYLQGIEVDEGQLIKRGQKMFQIMPMLFQAEVQKAQAEADLTELEYNNTKLLADKQIVSPNELALDKAKVNRAQAQLTLATRHQGLTEIRAAFSGIMGRFQVRLGSLVDEGDLLTTLSDNSSVWVYFNVTEADYLNFKTQSRDEKPKVGLLMANGQMFKETGQVETIEADFNNETGNIAFRAVFPNPDGLLRHGETGKIVMTTSLPDALLIPQMATFDVLEKKYVFVVDEKNVVHSREIKVHSELPQLFVVGNGIDENDKILLEGLRRVKDGSVIDVNFRKPAEVIAKLEVPAE